MRLIADSIYLVHLRDNHDIGKTFTGKVRNCGILSRISYWQEHQEFFIVWPAKESPECWATVERGGGEGDQASHLDSSQ